MGNFVTVTQELKMKIDITKQDISRDYDLSTISGVEKANAELINCFSNLSENDLRYVKNHLFTQIKN